MTKWLKVFKVGTPHPRFEFTEVVVREIASTYDYDHFRAPHSMGHYPSPGAPALAWIPPRGVRFTPRAARFAEDRGVLEILFDPALLTKAGYAALVSGNYRTLSPAFYAPEDTYNPTPGKWHLRHLAWLGSENPAGKGIDFLDDTLLEGFTPPEKWRVDDKLTFDEHERPGKTFVIFSEVPPSLDELKIAVRETPWNEIEARIRIKQAFGLDGLREYGLVTDWAKDYLDESRYGFLVADMISNEAMLVPAAVKAALERIPGLPLTDVWVAEDRDRALSRARTLEEKIEKEQPTGFFEPNGGIHVERKKLLELIQSKAKGIVPDDKLVAFGDNLADSIFGDTPNFADLAGSTAVLFAEKLITAELEKYKAQSEAAQARTALRDQTAQFAETQRTTRITSHVDRLIAEGRIPIAEKANFVAFAKGFKDKEGVDLTFVFTENDQQVTKPLYEVFFSRIVPTLVKEKTFVPPSRTMDADETDPAFGEVLKEGDRIANALPGASAE